MRNRNVTKTLRYMPRIHAVKQRCLKTIKWNIYTLRKYYKDQTVSNYNLSTVNIWCDSSSKK